MYNYRQLYAILKDLNIQGADITKEEAVLMYTEGRTTSVRDMRAPEWRNMINGLNSKTKGFRPERQKQKDPMDNLRKRLLNVFHELAAAKPEVWGSYVSGGKANIVAILGVLNRLGCVQPGKARLNLYNKVELTKLISQFDNILKKEYGKGKA